MTHSNLLKITALSSALIFASNNAFAQKSMSTVGTASATVVKPLSIVQSQALSFGNIITSGTEGSVESGGTVTGGTKTAGGTISNAEFIVSASDIESTTLTNLSITDSFQGTPNRVTLSDGTNTMTATLTPPTMTGGSIAIAQNGNATLTVIGKLAVKANQAIGYYSGTYNVAVNY